MIRHMVMLAVVIAAMNVAGATAEEKYGVPVYPGAKYDDDMTRYLDDVLYVEGAAYRTPDDPASVAAFYAKQGLVSVKGKSKAHAVFKKENVEVFIQGPPRKDMASGKKLDDTLITITKED